MTPMKGVLAMTKRTSFVLALSLFAVLATLMFSLAGGASADPGTHLILNQSLPGNAVKKVWSNGVTYVGNKNGIVTWTLNSAGEVASASVSVPGPASSDDVSQLAQQYRNAGRSPQSDAKNAGDDLPSSGDTTPQTSSSRMLASMPRGVGRIHYNYGTANSIYDSGCLNLNRSDMYSSGCYTRKGTSSTDCCAFYLADSSQISAHANLGGHWLLDAWQQHQYGSANSIIQWAPGSDVSSGSCTTTSIGISAFGASLSRSYTLCPTKIHVNKTQNVLLTQWQGCKASSTTVGAAEGAFTKVPSGGNASLVYSIGGDTWNVGC